MPSALLRALAERYHIPHLDERNIDAFLNADGDRPSHAILFFAGDPAQHAEADDVAVVFPELLAAFNGRVRGAVIVPAAEEQLKERFHIHALPSLAILRGGEPVGSIARIRDWAEYIEKIEAYLAPDAPLLKSRSRPSDLRCNEGVRA